MQPQKLLNTDAFPHITFHTQTRTQHTEKLLHQKTFAQILFLHRCSHTHTHRERESFYTQRTYAHKTSSAHTNELLDVGTFTHKSFLHTQASDASPAQENRTFPQFSDVLGSTHISFREWSPQEKPNRDFALRLESAGVSHGKGCSGASAQ